MAPLATSRGDSQESWGIASGLVEGSARDLALGIDAGAVDQIQGGVRRNEGIEVCHYAVLPKERPAVEVYIAREANHLAFVVDVVGYAQKIPRKRTKVGHRAVLPEESVRGCVAGQV